MMSSAIFTVHPRALRAFRSDARQNGTTPKPAASGALLLACLAATPAPYPEGKSTMPYRSGVARCKLSHSASRGAEPATVSATSDASVDPGYR